MSRLLKATLVLWTLGGVPESGCMHEWSVIAGSTLRSWGITCHNGDLISRKCKASIVEQIFSVPSTTFGQSG